MRTTQATQPAQPDASPTESPTPNRLEDGLYGKPALLAMLGIALVVMLASVDQTIVSTALPRIVADLEGFDLYPWVVTSYLLTSTVCIPIIGKLSDLYGRKPFLLTAIALFVGSSAVAGLSWSMLVLILARAVQGIGSGMFLATAFTSVGDIFPQPERRARWQGMLASTFGLSSMVGPTIGGIMTDMLGWRSVFYVNLPIGILALLVIWRTLPADLSPRVANAQIDWGGAVTITAGMSSLLFIVEWGGNTLAWSSPAMLGLITSAIVFIGGFIIIEHRVPEPLIPPKLFAIPALLGSSLASFLTGFGMFGLIFYTPLFMQGSMGLSPSMAGLLQTPLVASLAVGSLLSGQTYAKVKKSRPFVLTGSVLFMIGTLLLTQATPTMNHSLLAAELALCGVGVGMQWPIMLVIIQIVVPRSQQGVGNALIRFLRLIGSMLGTAVMGVLVSTIFHQRIASAIPGDMDAAMRDILLDPQVLVQPEAQAKLREMAEGMGPQGQAMLDQVLFASREALAAGVLHGYVLIAAMGILSFLVAFALIRDV